MAKNKKAFLLGVLTGILILCGYHFIFEASEDKDPIQYLEKPLSYENKTETSFQVFQVLDDAALAREVSYADYDMNLYLGNIVLFKGANYYNGQVLKVKNPMRIGTYKCTDEVGRPVTVPVIRGEISD